MSEQHSGELWEPDLTDIWPARAGYKYMLVFIDIFSG